MPGGAATGPPPQGTPFRPAHCGGRQTATWGRTQGLLPKLEGIPPRRRLSDRPYVFIF